jgi:hypothetical protein
MATQGTELQTTTVETLAGNSSPRTPVYANWATSPLVPRKSPERFNKRLALGHKTTQVKLLWTLELWLTSYSH